MHLPTHICLSTFQSSKLNITHSALSYRPRNREQVPPSVSHMNHLLSSPLHQLKKPQSTELSTTVILFYLHHYKCPGTLTVQHFHNTSRLQHWKDLQIYLPSNLNVNFILALALHFNGFQCLSCINTLKWGQKTVLTHLDNNNDNRAHKLWYLPAWVQCFHISAKIINSFAFLAFCLWKSWKLNSRSHKQTCWCSTVKQCIFILRITM